MTLVDIQNMLGQGKIKFLTDSAGKIGLLKMSIWKHAFNSSPCLFEPNTINSVLSGFNFKAADVCH